ncbi:MAG: PQQ-binding-like beta-propeller repeat protein, partial [Myxococcota bacterium]
RGSRTQCADVHAMLFHGRLWAFVHGRKTPIATGPVLLVAQRMVVAVRALVDGWQAGRPTNVRLRTGAFSVGLRLDKRERASLAIRTPAGEVRIDDVRPEEVALPMLRVATDLIRALIASDRSQSKNLRVCALRDEARALRKSVREQGKPDGFTNPDAERLRLAAPLPAALTAPALPAPSGAMRFEARWQIELDGLDAERTFFCGDRIVLGGRAHCVAVDRNTGDVLWAREGAARASMAGATLLRIDDEGGVEFCSVEDGEAFATTRITGGAGVRSVQLSAAGSRSVAILDTEGLSAYDLRTGQPNWRVRARGGAIELTRAGRLLLLTDGSAVHAIDGVTGEDLWRFAVRGRFSHAPAVIGRQRPLAIAVTDGRRGQVYGIDLSSGQERFRLSLGEAPGAAPVGAGDVALLTLGDERLIAVDEAGEVRFDVADPGLSIGASALVVDDLLVTNTPGGGIAGTELTTGGPRWTELLGDPIGDEVPRCLEPVLRGGALFVPAGDVYVVRPADGAVLGALDGELVPDRLRVDERGWVYVAEESGHVAAHSPARSLRLIRGGA